LRSQSAGTSTSGVIGIPFSTSVVDHLACTECFRMYASADRGYALQEILERPLKNFVNPEYKPTDCPTCTLAVKTAYSTGFPHRVERIPQYLYCEPCQKILWKFTREEQYPQLKEIRTELEALKNAKS
jgi:hypothetical protein